MSVLEWVANARHGDAYEYARGNLAYSRQRRAQLRFADAEIPAALDRLCDAAEDAWRLYEAGKVTLVQHRAGRDDFRYLAIRLRA